MKKVVKNGFFLMSNGNVFDDYNFEIDYIEDGIIGDQEGDGEDVMEGVNQVCFGDEYF